MVSSVTKHLSHYFASRARVFFYLVSLVTFSFLKILRGLNAYLLVFYAFFWLFYDSLGRKCGIKNVYGVKRLLKFSCFHLFSKFISARGLEIRVTSNCIYTLYTYRLHNKCFHTLTPMINMMKQITVLWCGSLFN